MVVKTLDEMAAGGMYDLLGGGFHRYSVDDRLARRTSRRCSTTTRFWRPHTCTAGSSPAPTAIGRSSPRRSDTCCASCCCPRAGSPRAGCRHQRRRGADVHLTEEGVPAGLLEPFEHGRLIIRGELNEATRARLFAVRSSVRAPLRDDKAIASWNGLALAALAEAGRRLGRPDWIEAAHRLGDFLLGPLAGEGGRLRRSYRDGRTSGDGYLDDYANVAHGLLELHVATGDLRWLREARRLALLAIELFADDEHGGFFLSPADGEELVAERRSWTTTRSHPATRCSRTCCSAWRGSTATTSRAPRRVRCSGCYGLHSSECRRRSAGRCRTRPASEPAARARDRRACRLRRGSRGARAVAAEGGRGGRSGRGCTSARG